MYKTIYKLTLLFFIVSTFGTPLWSQENHKIDFTTISKSDILKMSYDQLLDLSFIDLKRLAETAGLTTDELMQLALNQEVSTASKKGESLFESPLSASVISKEEIVLSGATTFEELFRLVQGMIVRQESNGNFDIHIRGNDNVPKGNMSHLSENTLSLVMIDNRIVYNYINGGTMWETLPVSLSDVERIEIVRGPSSSLYGPNAVSGVINIITKKPTENGVRVYGDLQAGNHNTKTGSMSVLGKVNDKFQWKASGSFDYRERMNTDFYDYYRNEYLPTVDTSMFGNPFFAQSPEPELAKDALSGNGAIYYSPNSKVNLQLNTGMQKSRAQTVFFENLATPLGISNSETGYIDFKGQAYGLEVQANYLKGNQNLHELMLKPVIKYDFSFVTGNIEYDLNLNKLGIGELTLRPGINFQQATYDDSKYIKEYQEEYSNPLIGGLLNGKSTIKTTSGNIRLDYKPIGELRFIGSFRADKYNEPDKTYYSYQAAASYNFRSKHLLRFVASKANRSAFIGDVYANYYNPLRIEQGMQLYQVYAGFNSVDNDQKYTLLTQTMVEFGVREILSDKIQIDIELFRTETKNFSTLMADSSISGREVNNQLALVNIWEYQNIDVKSTQLGISGAILLNPIKKLNIKIFGTVQKTKLADMTTTLLQDSLVDVDAKNTPAFYGGVTLNYSFLDRWNLNTSAYIYTDQIYERYRFEEPKNHVNMSTKIDANAIVNIKLAYRVSGNNTIYVSIRNITNHNKAEFGYADKIQALYMAGMNFNF